MHPDTLFQAVLLELAVRDALRAESGATATRTQSRVVRRRLADALANCAGWLAGEPVHIGVEGVPALTPGTSPCD